MSLLQKNKNNLIKRLPVDMSAYTRSYELQIADIKAAHETLLGINDRRRVLKKFIERYAYVLERIKTASGSEENIFRRVKDAATEAAFLSGQHEVIRTMFFESCVRAQSTLFSESSYYTYNINEGDSDEKLENDMTELRDSGCNIAQQRWDAMSCALQSSLLYIFVSGDKLKYKEVSPAAAWVVMGDSVIDSDGIRPTDETDIDEAYAVVMCLDGAQAADGVNKFAAWLGPSDRYPTGRHCVYEARNWHDLPLGFSDDPAFNREYTVAGEYVSGYVSDEQCANPLSLWASKQRRYDMPTYPFAVCYGDKMSSGIVPVSTSLYEDSLEIDLAASTILGAAGRAARGTQVFQESDGGSAELPPNTDGTIIASRGWTFLQAGWDAAHSERAMNVIKELSRQKAEARSVPGFLVAATGQQRPTSGREVIALSEPLQRNRRERIQLNKESVSRVFDITRAIVNATNGKDVISPDVVETWHPGDRAFMIDPMDKLLESEKRIELNMSTLIEEARRIDGFRSSEEALNALAERKKQMDEAGDEIPQPLAPQLQQPRGILGSRASGR